MKKETSPYAEASSCSIFLITLLYDALKQGTSPICPLKKTKQGGKRRKIS